MNIFSRKRFRHANNALTRRTRERNTAPLPRAYAATRTGSPLLALA